MNLQPSSERPLRYEDGIALAESKGFIRRHGTPNEDGFSHLSPYGLNEMNTRTARPLVRATAKLYDAQEKPWKCLELGPGAGVAIGEISRLTRNAALRTVTRTALNSYLRLLYKASKLRELVLGVLESEEYVDESTDGIELHRDSVSISTLMQLQHLGLLRTFAVLPEPFVIQELGEFLSVDFNGESFELAFENNGPVRHSDYDHTSCAKAYEVLSPSGTLILSPFDDPEFSHHGRRFFQSIQSLLAPGDSIGIHHPAPYRQTNCDLVIGRAESPLKPIIDGGRLQELTSFLHLEPQ